MISPSEKSTSPIDDDSTVVLRQNAKNQLEPNNNNADNGHKMEELLSPSVEINRLQIASDFAQETMLQQPRNRLGLLLTPSMDISASIAESISAQTPVQSRSKQGSPFYAEPADALANVLRRSQRVSQVPKTQRHSEPPKGPFQSIHSAKMLSPIDSEKSHQISGSLDELKNKPNAKPTRSGRLDPWPVDSSWEFMGNEDHDYDTDANWNAQPTPNQMAGRPILPNVKCSPILGTIRPSRQENRLVINQFIAKRLPELNISEILQKTVLPASSSSELSSRNDVGVMNSNKGNRLSSYDNVERTAHSGYATSMFCHDSSHSDDGTVFSEPWDSSQWDSFMPHDGE